MLYQGVDILRAEFDRSLDPIPYRAAKRVEFRFCRLDFCRSRRLHRNLSRSTRGKNMKGAAGKE